MSVVAPSGFGGILPQRLDEYRWIFIADVCFAAFAAYGIGANDVANAFGTSVGSKAITMRQAVIIAAVCEFCGAFFLGSQVTSTIAGGIAKSTSFVREPELFMFGMMCVDLSVGLWLWIATYLELPVSTTHSAVGAVIGMALVLGGADSVFWAPASSSPPGVGGVAGIVISWVTSPILAAVAAALLFFLVRLLVLRSEHSFRRSFVALPIVVALATAVNFMIIIRKGLKNQGGNHWPEWAVQSGAWTAAVAAGLACAAGMPYMRDKILVVASASRKGLADDEEPLRDSEGGVMELEMTRTSMIGKLLSNTVDYDIHKDIARDAVVSEMHSRAETFDPNTEEAFKYLQVFTAACNSLAHGANDVANAIGPLAAVAQIYQTGTFSTKAPVARWVLLMGGCGIVVGLATYGYKIMRVLGLKTIKITATRGFSIELAAAAVVITASAYGLPVSTTHCAVGATIGVGTLEGASGVHWVLFLRMIAGWVATLVVAAGLAAFMVALGVYTPSRQMASQIRYYEDGLRNRSEAYTYAYQWTADAAARQPQSLQWPVFNASGYFAPIVPDHQALGVPNDKTYLQWNPELWQSAGMWSLPTSWQRVWQQAIGEAPSYATANTSTLTPAQVFAAFDRVQALAFSANQQAEIQAILSGEKVLCCQEQYLCCPRQCSYRKVQPDCRANCEMQPTDASCVERTCADASKLAQVSFAPRCMLVDDPSQCPMPMSMDSTSNYVGPHYVSAPIQSAPVQPYNDMYGRQYTSWREPNYDVNVPVCPVLIT